jgi:hypothetical protein
MPSVRKVSGTDSKSTSANAIASSAVVLDLALVEATSSDSGRVAVNYGGYDIVRVDARLGDGVGDDEAALRVAAERLAMTGPPWLPWLALLAMVAS